MEDSEVVAAIVAGDPGGLAEAYDKYAVPLYAYCRSILREPADAADAVQDTFIIASARLGGLRDPGKLRAWLYAVARNVCHQRLRAGEATAALDEAADVPSESADVGRAAERAELTGLVRAAMAGLNPADRDILELSLGPDVDAGDLAEVLGVSRKHAHARLSRARDQMERSLAALLVARTGREDCPALDALLVGWDGRLTVLLRKRIGRHIDRCAICGERRRRELGPTLLPGALPLVAVLPGFRGRVLKACADSTPQGLAHRAAALGHAGPFGATGFPKPSAPPWHRPLTSHSRAARPASRASLPASRASLPASRASLPASRASRFASHLSLPASRVVTAGAAAAVVAAGVIAAVTIGGGAHHGLPSALGPSGAIGGPGPTPAATAGPSSPGPARSPGSSGPAASPGRGGSRPASPAATAGATATPGSSRSPAPTSTAATPGSSPSASPSPAVSQGTLAVTPARLELVIVNGKPTGTITLTAEGGPVTGYTVTVGSAAVGKLTVSPSSGSLASGASVTITVTAASLVALDAQLTINPGGHTVTVLLTLTT